MKSIRKAVVSRLRRKPAFQPRPDDVFLVSYPRSGNTWMRYLLANLLEPQGEWHIENIGRVIPDIHETWPAEWIPRRPRILKSHYPYRAQYRKVIYLYRDGRDVAISYHHFLVRLHDDKRDFPAFFIDFLHGRVPYGAWHEHVAGWMASRESTCSLLPIQYRALYDNPLKSLQRVGDFLGYQWSNEQISTAIEKSSYLRLQRDYQVRKYQSHWRKGFQGGVKGGPGKWKEVLTAEQNELFWEITGSISEKLGLEYGL